MQIGHLKTYIKNREILKKIISRMKSLSEKVIFFAK